MLMKVKLFLECRLSTTVHRFGSDDSLLVGTKTRCQAKKRYKQCGQVN